MGAPAAIDICAKSWYTGYGVPLGNTSCGTPAQERRRFASHKGADSWAIDPAKSFTALGGWAYGVIYATAGRMRVLLSRLATPSDEWSFSRWGSACLSSAKHCGAPLKP